MLSPQFMFLIRVLHKKGFLICCSFNWWHLYNVYFMKWMESFWLNYVWSIDWYRDKLIWLEMENFGFYLIFIVHFAERLLIFNLLGFFFFFSGDKPHACELCNKKFALACNLRAHMKTHEGRFLFIVFYFLIYISLLFCLKCIWDEKPTY